MGDYRGRKIPEGVSYDLGYHVWAKVEGGLVSVGATDPAQQYAGEIIHLGIKKVGTRLERGAILATIESAKYMGPMRSPVTGTVAEVNAEVSKKPSLVNRDAYLNWVARVTPEKLDEDMAALTPGPAALDKYKPIIDEWEIEASGKTG